MKICIPKKGPQKHDLIPHLPTYTCRFPYTNREIGTWNAYPEWPLPLCDPIMLARTAAINDNTNHRALPVEG